MANFPRSPKHPERICWGCDKFCPADDMRCGNGTIRAPHPVELIGDDWWKLEEEPDSASGLVTLRFVPVREPAQNHKVIREGVCQSRDVLPMTAGSRMLR